MPEHRGRHPITPCDAARQAGSIRASGLIKADLTFERPPALVRDPNPSDLERSAAGYHNFALRRCEPVTHQVKQFGREPRKEHWISAAVLSSIGEHFECKAYSAAHYIIQSYRTWSDTIVAFCSAGLISVPPCDDKAG